MNKNEYCESYFLSKLGSPWTQIKSCNKDIIDRVLTFGLPQLLSLLFMHTDHSLAGAKFSFFFVPVFPLFEDGKLVIPNICVFMILMSKFYCKGRKAIILSAWVPFFCLLQCLLSQKENGRFHTFTHSTKIS